MTARSRLPSSAAALPGSRNTTRTRTASSAGASSRTCSSMGIRKSEVGSRKSEVGNRSRMSNVGSSGNLKASYRFLLYSHDTYGLGHLRRSLSIAWGLQAAFPKSSTLIITGSSATGFFPAPRHCDLLKLPAVTKDVAGRYVSRELSLPFHRLLELRADVIDAAVRSFLPDLVLVDHAPLGMAGELFPALCTARRQRPETRIVLGLRDI